MIRFFYSLLLYVVSPLVVAKLLFNSFRNPDYRERIAERFGNITFAPDSRKVIWLHAVSVGEVQAAKPLITRLLSEYPDYRLVVTTITPTGAVTAKQNFGENIEHYYLPYDLPHAVSKFLNKVKPAVLLVMETEIWPNLVYLCHKAGVTKVLLNARISDRSFKGYKLASRLISQTVSLFDFIVAQSKQDADRLQELGAAEATLQVGANLKFDVTVATSILEQAQSVRRFLSVNRAVFIAASTHEGEEELILSAFDQVKDAVPGCLLILAPRHPDRTADIIVMCEALGFDYVTRSRETGYSNTTDIYVLDTLGELAVFYACADVAFVGGSLVPSGGHNVLEPASIGIPVVTGPHTFNFREIIHSLRNENALFEVSDGNELVTAVTSLLTDASSRHGYGERARQFVQNNRGGVDKIMELLQQFLPKLQEN